DRRIVAGQEWDRQIDKHLESADIILLLVSPDFLASHYCYDIEVKRAMERHDAGEARVIPIILRHCDDWQSAPFGKLQAVPKDARPVTDWPDHDKAFADVAAGIRRAVEELLSSREEQPETLSSEATHASQHSAIPRRPAVGFVPRRDATGSIVERLQEELAPHKNQLVALWGAGGVGKTTLTAEAARGLEEAGQRIVWVSADGRVNFTLSTLLDDIAAQLGRTDLRPLALEPKGEVIRTLIADAPTLIVLDNFETIPPNEQLPCINFLAEKANCPSLITTRELIDGARSIPLRSMLAEEGSVLLDRLVEQTSNPGIYTEAVRGRILETAEYNPLVIQWIVRQINLANDPEEVLTDLAHGEGEAAARVFDRSFNLPQMEQGGRAVLLALSLFMPSATRPALAEVAGMGKDRDKKRFKKAQETLASLWLLTQASGGQRLAVEGLTREFAKARLSHDPRSKPFRQRFVNRFLRYAEANSKDTAEHLNSIEAEKDNILNAMDVALEMDNWGSAMRLCDAVFIFLDLRGYWDEAVRRVERTLSVARDLTNEHWITVFTHNLAMLYQQQGAIDEARRLFSESLDIAKRLGNQSGIAITLHHLAWLAQDQGEVDEARRLYGESSDIAKRLGDQSGIAATLHQLAWLAQEQGEMDEARRLYSESLDITKRLGNQSGIALTLHNLAMLAQDQGEVDEARRLYGESLDIAKKLGDQSGIAATLHQLGIISIDEGDLPKAENLFNESLTILRKLGHKQNVAECLESIGNLKVIQGSLSEARSLFDEALQMAQALSDKFRIGSVKHSLVLLEEKNDNRAGARELFREALNIFEKLGSPKAEIARENLARVEGESS
ncbi:MAG: tetratricopeptide repeat protein, partial [Rubrivivax sp.]|nr:tetratricopeptide repeat protein [Pyrinomonadaceae bacterium]